MAPCRSDYGEAPNASSPPQGGVVPDGCNADVDLSPQEKVLEFMVFNLTSCLTPPGVTPTVSIAPQ